MRWTKSCWACLFRDRFVKEGYVSTQCARWPGETESGFFSTPCRVMVAEAAEYFTSAAPRSSPARD